MFNYDYDYAEKTTVRREWALYSLQALSAVKLARIVNQILQGEASLYNSIRNEKKSS